MKKLSTIIEYLIYALAFFLPLQTRWIIKAGFMSGYSEYATYSLYGTDILLFFILILFVFWKIKNKNFQFPISNFRLWNHWTFIALLELGTFVSIFFAADKTLALFAYARLLFGIGLFWVIYEGNFNKNKLSLSFLSGLALQSCLGIWQFVTQSSFSSKWLGLAAHPAGVLAGESVIETATGRWLRSYGGLDHPNMLGGVLALGLIILIGIGLALARSFYDDCIRTRDWSRLPIAKTIMEIFFFYAGLLTFATALFFTFSRAAWLSLALGLATAGIVALYLKDKVRLVQLAKILIALALLAATFYISYGQLAKTRALADGRLENKSLSERAQYLSDFKQVMSSRWLTGTGVGNYPLAVRELAPKSPAYRYQPVHNTFLLVWSETGIIGLSGFVGLILYAFIKRLSSLLNARKAKAFAEEKISLLLALAILMSFDHWFWSLHFGIFAFWFIMGFILMEEGKEEPDGFQISEHI